MATIHRDERGQVVEATDAYGTYYYLADDFGNPTFGAWADREMALAAFEGDGEPGTLEINARGERMVECAYCHRNVPVRPVPDADDEYTWGEEAHDHAEDCEWLVTRAHRLEAR